jgi:hypothetical protein
MFLIATERCRLAYEGRDEPDDVIPPFYRNMKLFLPLALDNLEHMREIYWGDWFWHAAGMIENDVLAQAVYEAGLWNVALPTGNVSDATLVGWAGTIGAREAIDADSLERVREHLSSGFWQRMTADRIDAFGRSPIILHRFRRGLARLRTIQLAMDLAKRGRLAGTARYPRFHGDTASERRKIAYRAGCGR